MSEAGCCRLDYIVMVVAEGLGFFGDGLGCNHFFKV